MKIFLDTTNRDYIKKFISYGLVDGITTNPSLLSKEGSNLTQIIREICAMVSGPVSIEVVEKDPIAVLTQARQIAKIAPNAVVKIPFIPEYFSCIKTLVNEDIAVNVTLVFTQLQALCAAKMGVTMISSFIGRLDDLGIDGFDIVEQVVQMKKVYQFSSAILGASVRSLHAWQRMASIGVDIVTISPALFESALHHPLTEKGVVIFDNDWKKVTDKTFFND